MRGWTETISPSQAIFIARYERTLRLTRLLRVFGAVARGVAGEGDFPVALERRRKGARIPSIADELATDLNTRRLRSTRFRR
jgi:hypothetical protein